MDSLKVKIFLLKNRLTVRGMAREMCPEGRSEDALRVMLSQMINGQRFYPTLARQVEKRYGLKLSRPAQPKQRAA